MQFDLFTPTTREQLVLACIRAAARLEAAELSQLAQARLRGELALLETAIDRELTRETDAARWRAAVRARRRVPA